MHEDAGDSAAALAARMRSVVIKKAIYDHDPSNAEAGNQLASTYMALSQGFHREGQLPEAIRYGRLTVDLREHLVVTDSLNAIARSQLGEAYLTLARVSFDHAVQQQTPAPAAARDVIRYFDQGLATMKALQAEGVAASWFTELARYEEERAQMAAQLGIQPVPAAGVDAE